MSLATKIGTLSVLLIVAACAHAPPAPAPVVAAVPGKFPSAPPGPVSSIRLQHMVAGRTILIGTGRALYRADGSYSFDGASPGHYRVHNGRICVDFDDGNARCDRVISEDGNYYLIDRTGRRFQFRPIA